MDPKLSAINIDTELLSSAKKHDAELGAADSVAERGVSASLPVPACTRCTARPARHHVLATQYC